MISGVGRRRTFNDLRRDGLRVRHGAVRMNLLPRARADQDVAGPQLAFALGRSFGKAVDRNRGRRRLRAAFLQVWRHQDPARADLLDGAFLLAGSRALLSAPFTDLVSDVETCLARLATRPELAR